MMKYKVVFTITNANNEGDQYILRQEVLKYSKLSEAELSKLKIYNINMESKLIPVIITESLNAASLSNINIPEMSVDDAECICDYVYNILKERYNIKLVDMKIVAMVMVILLRESINNENIEVLQYKDIPTHISVENKKYLN